MNIRSKWLRALFACMMLGSVGFVAAGCADEGADTESLDDEAGSEDTGAGGVDSP